MDRHVKGCLGWGLGMGGWTAWCGYSLSHGRACRFHPLLPVSGTGTGFGPLSSRERGIGWCCLVHPRHPPPLWIADQVRNDGTMLAHRFHPHLSPLPSRERGNWWLCCRLCLLCPSHGFVVPSM